MKTPAVSVVIPSYNHGKYVGRCLQAFLGQTFHDFELIIIDDASSDDNVAQIEKYKDPRIRLIARMVNRGVTAGMNEGAQMARSKLICFFASDDIPDPDYLESLVKMSEANPSAIGFFVSCRHIDEDGNLTGTSSRQPVGIARNEILRRSFMGGNQMSSPGMAIRKNALTGDLPAGTAQFSDWILHNRLMLAGEVVISGKASHSYRISSSSLSSRSDLAISREAAETRLMMDDFLNILTISRVIEIFGKDAEEFEALPDIHVPYVLGRLALTSAYQEKRNWGYEIIMRHLSIKGMAEDLAACAKFTYKDFASMAPRIAGSPVKEINDLRRRLRRQRIISVILGIGLVAAIALWLAAR
jgi:glycosyltransferase involved in cell wall biosynthesis